MCSPTAAFAGLTALQLVQQQMNSSALEDYQNDLHRQNSAIANENAINQYISIGKRRIEEQAAASDAIQDVSLRADAARSTATAAAGAGGVAGQSFDALLADFERQELRFQTNILRTQEFRDAQFISDSKAIKFGLQGQLLSTLPQPVPQPDFLGAALRLVNFNLVSQQAGKV